MWLDYSLIPEGCLKALTLFFWFHKHPLNSFRQPNLWSNMDTSQAGTSYQRSENGSKPKRCGDDFVYGKGVSITQFHLSIATTKIQKTKKENQKTGKYLYQCRTDLKTPSKNSTASLVSSTLYRSEFNRKYEVHRKGLLSKRSAH